MFQQLQAHPDFTQAQHRALPHMANTDLSQLKAQLLGQPRAPNPQALTFGAGFHAAILEPAHYAPPTGLPPAQRRLLERLATTVRRHRYCRDLLYRGTPELTHTATHTETGLQVKVRPDLMVRSRAGRQLTLIDFKTTSCRDYAHFCATVEAYDYDRQAAFYSDVLQADRFLLIGVQKKAPYDLWLIELSADADTMQQGRKKYQRLLRAYAQQHAATLAA